MIHTEHPLDTPTRHPPGLAYAAWIVVCIVWGTGFAAYRVAAEATAPPLLFAGLRLLLAGLILLAIARLFGKRFPSSKTVLHLCLGGVLIEGTVNAAIAWASGTTASGMLGLVIATIPMWTALYDRAAYRGQASRAVMFAIGIGLSGALIALGAPSISFVHGPSPGLDPPVVLLILATMGAAWAYLTVQKLSQSASLPVIGGIQLSAAGGAVCLSGILTGEAPRFGFSIASLVAFLYLLVFGSLLAYSCLIYALRHLSATLVATHRFANPLVALLLGWFLFGETLTLTKWIGAALVLASLGLILRAQARPQPIGNGPESSKLSNR